MERLAAIFAMLCWTPAMAQESITGERLAYITGCVNCHHQTAPEHLAAPPLQVVQFYSFDAFKTLMRQGIDRNGRNLLQEGSLMGIVATEQFALMRDNEIQALYTFLVNDWTDARAAVEEAKIPILYPSSSQAP